MPANTEETTKVEERETSSEDQAKGEEEESPSEDQAKGEEEGSSSEDQAKVQEQEPASEGQTESPESGTPDGTNPPEGESGGGDPGSEEQAGESPAAEAAVGEGETPEHDGGQASGGATGVQRAEFQTLEARAGGAAGDNMLILMDVTVPVTVELGGTIMPLRQVLELGPGSVIPLDRPLGEPVDIVVNGELVGRGEVVVVGDQFGVQVTELVDPNARKLK